MSVLLLRLCGPMQSWGTQSRFTMRDTGLEPSKSGVIGLICAALGRPRSERVDDLAGLRMGVRVDREGIMKRDYQTAGGAHRKGQKYGVRTAEDKPGSTVTSSRYYLADADFLIGFESSDQEGSRCLENINTKLREPVWQLFLGRKACPPSVPVFLPNDDGIVKDCSLMDALMKYPWPRAGQGVPKEDKRPDRLRFVLETDYGVGEETRYDQPEGASFSTRRFLPRSVKTVFKRLGDEVPLRKEGKPCTSHD